MSYKCVDCDKTFLCPVEDLNETPKREEKSSNQIVFTLRKDENDDENHSNTTND